MNTGASATSGEGSLKLSQRKFPDPTREITPSEYSDIFHALRRVEQSGTALGSDLKNLERSDRTFCVWRSVGMYLTSVALRAIASPASSTGLVVFGIGELLFFGAFGTLAVSAVRRRGQVHRPPLELTRAYRTIFVDENPDEALAPLRELLKPPNNEYTQLRAAHLLLRSAQQASEPKKRKEILNMLTGEKETIGLWPWLAPKAPRLGASIFDQHMKAMEDSKFAHIKRSQGERHPEINAESVDKLRSIALRFRFWRHPPMGKFAERLRELAWQIEDFAPDEARGLERIAQMMPE